MKKTITIITPSLGLGGAEQWLRCLVTHCKDFRWIVCVLGGDPKHDLVVNAVVAHADTVYAPPGVHSKAKTLGTAAANIEAAVKEADCVITWGGGEYFPLPTKSPVVFVAHGSCQWSQAAAHQAISGGATHVVAVSQLAAEAMKPVATEVRTIMNGVDTSRLSLPADKKLVRSKWKSGAYDYAKYVGYLGRLGNEKNIDSIIHSVALLPYHYYLVFIGCTGWVAQPILNLARSLLRDRLIEVPATDNVGEALGALDCMVQVSPREGHSLSICEGMICGVPIISNRTGAIPELERMSGHDLVEHVPDEPLAHEIAEAIRSVCANPPLRRIEHAQHFARHHLTHSVMCKKWTSYLNEAMGLK